MCVCLCLCMCACVPACGVAWSVCVRVSVCNLWVAVKDFLKVTEHVLILQVTLGRSIRRATLCDGALGAIRLVVQSSTVDRWEELAT